MRIRTFAEGDAEVVVALWKSAGLTRPWNDPWADVRRKRTVQPEMFFVAEDGSGGVVGTAMAGYDGHRGWIHYLAVADEQRGTGLGRALVERAEAALAALGCPKVQLQVRPDNTGVVDFYERLGYAPYEVVDLGKRLIPDG
ncbi:GNAT family acetyltransferase [Saccharopolyspora sp. 6V]|uniref:GNAT family acetyltransferase n=1 Tax=Saccharopolyspora sp. 6V TaxID=2877239 RepID=UPI001CD80941|nr:GNAT family acetyltransferase [Saccharopolyspora sp. 6V]MCA1191429.1 GNAT family acetyltransferase [Saccharopolyspora sp. 6V]